MSNIPSQLRYTKDHEWVEQTSDGKFRVGITDFAQAALGDIVYIQLPKVGDQVAQGKVCGEVESTKSVSEIYAPLTGKIVSVNSELDAAPEILNSDPYGAGWIIEVEVSESSQLDSLLSPTDYQALIS
jgi:glycine cleavage system H protein